MSNPIFNRQVIAWSLFDWANSAFPTLITTFIFATYFSEKVAPNKILGMAKWADAVALSGLIIALLSPFLGAIADYEGRRKPWLAFFTLLCVIASALLWTVEPHPDNMHKALTYVVIGTVGLEVGMVFYNAMLSQLAPPGYTGRVSGWSWGLGYFGGLTCLVIALFGFIDGGLTWLHLNKASAEQIRIVGPFVAVWFFIFACPLFIFTPDQPASGIGIQGAIRKGTASLVHTLKSLRQFKNIMIFLLARMLYIDGLNTIFAFGGIYAAGTFHMRFAEVIQFGISMNIAAGLGAICFSWMDDYRGAKITVLTTIVIMLLCGAGMLITTSVMWFWILGLGLGLCVGPIQSASRSLMVHLAPKHLITEMFGLYAFSGKATAFIGPWLLGLVTLATQSQRLGMATVLIFMSAGAAILCKVHVSPKSTITARV